MAKREEKFKRNIPQFATTRRRTGRREWRRWFFWRRTPWRRQPSPREEWFGWVQTLLVSICVRIKVKHIYLIREKKPITSTPSHQKAKNLERGGKKTHLKKQKTKKRWDLGQKIDQNWPLTPPERGDVARSSDEIFSFLPPTARKSTIFCSFFGTLLGAVCDFASR